jgi:hypothetical protein
VDPHTVPSLPAAISAPRLAPYLARYNGNSQYAVRLYAWNLELSAAFWGPLSMLEITLRNALHDQMRQGRIDDWWNAASVNLESKEDRAFDRAIEKLDFAGNSTPTADDVVGATSMGLWVGLLDVGVARHPLYDYETNLWPRLQRAFPNRERQGRRQIHAKFNRLRVLRNRIAHHEPLSHINHVQQRDLIIDCIQLIDADIAKYVQESHRIDNVLTNREAAVTVGDCRF